MKKSIQENESESLRALERTLSSEATTRSMEILAILTRRKFDAYLAQGFTREEALQLVLAAKA